MGWVKEIKEGDVEVGIGGIGLGLIECRVGLGLSLSREERTGGNEEHFPR